MNIKRGDTLITTVEIANNKGEVLSRGSIVSVAFACACGCGMLRVEKDKQSFVILSTDVARHNKIIRNLPGWF